MDARNARYFTPGVSLRSMGQMACPGYLGNPYLKNEK